MVYIDIINGKEVINTITQNLVPVFLETLRTASLDFKSSNSNPAASDRFDDILERSTYEAKSSGRSSPLQDNSFTDRFSQTGRGYSGASREYSTASRKYSGVNKEYSSVDREYSGINGEYSRDNRTSEYDTPPDNVSLSKTGDSANGYESNEVSSPGVKKEVRCFRNIAQENVKKLKTADSENDDGVVAGMETDLTKYDSANVLRPDIVIECLARVLDIKPDELLKMLGSVNINPSDLTDAGKMAEVINRISDRAGLNNTESRMLALVMIMVNKQAGIQPGYETTGMDTDIGTAPDIRNSSEGNAIEAADVIKGAVQTGTAAEQDTFQTVFTGFIRKVANRSDIPNSDDSPTNSLKSCLQKLVERFETEPGITVKEIYDRINAVFKLNRLVPETLVENQNHNIIKEAAAVQGNNGDSTTVNTDAGSSDTGGSRDTGDNRDIGGNSNTSGGRDISGNSDTDGNKGISGNSDTGGSSNAGGNRGISGSSDTDGNICDKGTGDMKAVEAVRKPEVDLNSRKNDSAVNPENSVQTGGKPVRTVYVSEIVTNTGKGTVPKDERTSDLKQAAVVTAAAGIDGTVDGNEMQIGVNASINAENSNIQSDSKIHRENVIVKENLFNQVVEKAKVMISGEKSEMVMELKPDNLGKLSLKVVTERGLVLAKFMAENQQVKEVLEANMQLLKDSLEKQGLSVQGCSVSVSQDSERRFYRNNRYKSDIPESFGSSAISGQKPADMSTFFKNSQRLTQYGWSSSNIDLTA